MLKRSGGHEIAFSLFLVGGHSVASALIEKQTRTAIYEALGVAACVLIFIVIQMLIAYVQKKFL